MSACNMLALEEEYFT